VAFFQGAVVLGGSCPGGSCPRTVTGVDMKQNETAKCCNQWTLHCVEVSIYITMEAISNPDRRWEGPGEKGCIRQAMKFLQCFAISEMQKRRGFLEVGCHLKNIVLRDSVVTFMCNIYQIFSLDCATRQKTTHFSSICIASNLC